MTQKLSASAVTQADHPPQLELGLFGQVRVKWNGQHIETLGAKPLAILIYLYGRGPVSRDELAQIFWPHKAGALPNVRQALTTLRRQIGDGSWLREDANGLSVTAQSDFTEFQRLLGIGDDKAALELLGEGPLLGGLPRPSEHFETWLEEERASHSQILLRALQQRGEECSRAGDWEGARQMLLRALALEPDETTYRLLMELEHRAHNTDGALQWFEECRQMVQQEFGSAPDSKTLELLAQIEAQSAGEHQRGQLLTAGDLLPEQDDPLFGREALRQKVSELLHSGKRALLHGLGGLGKTRLASAVAASYLSAGQRMVWLEAGADSGEIIVASLAEVLKVRTVSLEALKHHNVGLLVLDNAASSYAVQTALQALPPELPVLVTSRLKIPNVPSVEVGRLERESSLQLLRHHLNKESALPASFNAEALCALLGDHPFALRLAALTLAHAGSAEVLASLYAAPHDTIRALLHQSLSTVTPRQYEVFLAMGSLYAPHATPELLTHLICRTQSEIEEALWQLAQRGLLSKESRAGSDTLNFRMHDLTWHAAREHQAHLPHHLVQAVTDYARANTDHPDLLATDLPHLLGAANAAPPLLLTRLMCGWLGGGYIGARGFPMTALHLLERATQIATAQADWSAASLLGGKHADIAQALLGNQLEAIARLLTAADHAAKAGDQAKQAIQLALAGYMEAVNDKPEAWAHLGTAQQLARHTDAVTQARVLSQIAMTHASRKDFVQAHQLLSESKEVLEREVKGGQASKAVWGAYLGALGNLGQAEKRLGNLTAALALKGQMAQLAADCDERLFQARAALDQGELLGELGRPDEAIAKLRQAIELSQGIGAGNLESAARRLLQDLSSVQ